MIDVSVIIVNYNTCVVTKACIDSIYQYTSDISFEIILVDNNSTDESKELFEKDKRIVYLYQTSNWGFGKANNIGYEHSSGKYIFLLNSDTLLRSNAIKEFYDYMEHSSNKVAFVGTMLKDLDNNIIHSYNRFPNLYTGIEWYSIIGGFINKFRSINKRKEITVNGKVDYITGADLFIRTNAIKEYGLFDPDFFMYFEETELQYRYSKNGFESHIYSKPHIIHLENYSMNKSYNNQLKKLSISLDSYFLYLKKCKGSLKYLLFRILYIFISPLWILHPKYSIEAKTNIIKKAFSKL